MKPIPGRLFIFAFALVIAAVAAFGFHTLRQASDRRFAISIRAEPEASAPDIIPLGRPILVRIEKRTAGRSSQVAVAMLLDGDGRPLTELVPLSLRTLPNGKPVEEATFPPLSSIPNQRLVAGVVVRMPPDQLPTARQAIADVLRTVQARDGHLREAFGNLLPVCRRLGGHAEFVQAQVRATP